MFQHSPGNGLDAANSACDAHYGSGARHGGVCDVKGGMLHDPIFVDVHIHTMLLEDEGFGYQAQGARKPAFQDQGFTATDLQTRLEWGLVDMHHRHKPWQRHHSKPGQ